MAVASAADIAKARAASQVAARGNRTRRPQFQYPALDKTRQFVIQLVGASTYVDERYGEEKFGKVKVALKFVVLVKGAHGAVSAEDQLKWRMKHHGRPVRRDYNPIITAPGVNRAGEATKPSNLYNDLCIILNDGKPLTQEQLGVIDDKALVAWAEEYNLQLKAAGEDKLDLRDIVLLRTYHQAEHLAKVLNELERSRPQLDAMLEPYTIKSGQRAGQPDVKLKLLVGHTEEALPDFEPYPAPYDPREAGDDPSVVCSVTGQPLRGFEASAGDKPEWWSNARWAEEQVKKLGAEFRLVWDGKEYAPPFGPKFYWRAREQWEASRGSTTTETAPAPSTAAPF